MHKSKCIKANTCIKAKIGKTQSKSPKISKNWSNSAKITQIPKIGQDIPKLIKIAQKVKITQNQSKMTALLNLTKNT